MPDEATTIFYVSVFNYVEAVAWIVAALIVQIKARGFKRSQVGNSRIASATFVAFGFSDYIEAHTGAWWRPFSLLVLKCGCVIILVACYYKHSRLKSESSHNEKEMT
ncbi:MAG: hypothetical protein HY360_12765 [Verrucomicrobia bacterium]|nr:hypothetical protein [Verrucomicrobiota bacterium]